MLSINPSELIWTVINFFLMLFLLKHFLYTPVSEFMEKRQAKIDAGRAEERRAEEELNANRERLAAEKAESRRQAAQLLSDTQAQNGERTAAALAAAKTEAESALQTGEAALDARCDQEEAELEAHKAELSALLTAQVLGKVG